MPDVGALNLTIKSNATMAANGLNNLADALVRVKAAVGKGLGLGTVGTQVKQLAKTINEAQGTSTVVKNLASLFNAISNFSKLKSVKIDVKPFRELKDAIGDGISLGQAGAQMLKMREAMEGQWNGDSAVSSMNQVASAASVFKTEGTAKTLASVAKSMTEYAKAAKAMQKSGIVEMHGGGTPGSDVQSRIKLNLQQFGKNIKKETEPVYEQLKMDLDSIARDSAFDKMAQSIDKCFGPVENLDSGVQDVQKSIANTTAEAGQYSEGINRALDFSKFDVSKLPMDRIGEKLGEAGQQVQMFKDTVQTTGETTTSIIAYNENLATSWEAICARMAESGRLVTFDSVEETAKFLGMSVDDVKKRLQETYNMVYEGKRQGTIFSTLEQAAKELGITVEEVNKELQKTFEMVYGKSIDSGFNDATESIKESTQASKAFKESVGEIAESVVAGEKKIDLLAQKANIVEAQANKRINMLLDKGRDPDRDKTLVNYKLQIMALNAEIEKLTDVESRKFRSGSMLDFSEQSSTIEAYKMKLQALKSELEEGIKTGLWDDKKIANAIIQITQLTAKIEKLEDQQAGQALLISSEDALKAAENFLEANDDISILKMRLEELKMQMGQGILSGNMDATKLAHLASQIRSVTEKIKEMENATKKSGGLFTKFASGAGAAFGKLKNILKETFPFLNKINHQFGRILMRRAITAVIRSITKAFKEGVENVYKYSEAIGSSFAPALDSAKSMITQFKNSIGAAAAPLIQALIPVFNQIVSAAIQVINVLNQLFALLGGQSSWTRALPATSKAFEDTKNAAKGAGGAVKDMLADFDELNVLDQSGGGGGGGAAAATAEAYENMFEQVGEFDEKIRNIANFIKDTVGWIKDNFDIVLATAGLIATAILGWKISKAFDGALATIGKLIAGAALVTLGVVLEFDFGKKLGAYLAGGKALSWADLAEGIVGVVAAGIGGYIIGGGFGAAIGITIALTAAIAGIAVGWKDEKDKQKWGEKSLTPEEVERLVKAQFTFDIEAEVNILNEKINNSRAAKAHLDREIYEFSLMLDKIKIGVEDSDTLFADAIAQYNNVATQFNAWAKEDQNLLHAYLKVMPYDDSTKTKITKDVVTADSELSDYFRQQGERMAQLYDEGMRTGWKNNEKEQILALMEHVDNITSAAESIYAESKLSFDLEAAMGDMSEYNRDAALSVLEMQKARIDEFRKTTEETYSQLKDSYLKKAAYADAAGLTETAETYRSAARFLVDTFETEYDQKLASSTSNMRESWITTLQNVYAHDYGRDVASKSSKIFINDLRQQFKSSEKLAQNYILEFMDKIIHTNDVTYQASELFDITGWDLLGEDLQKKFFDNVYQAVGVDGVRLLKNALNLNAYTMINVSGWDAFSVSQKFEFLNALMSAYGAPEALAAAKNAGINVAEMIQAGLDSKDPDIRRTAQGIADAVRSEIENRKINVGVNADLAVQIDALVNVVPKVEGGVIGAVKSVVTNTVAEARSIFEKLGAAVKQIPVQKRANGAYGIPNGDLFIANEAGPELVGTIGGKTSVANQGQIIEGISTGVERANEEQNALLREQNNLLRRLLEKDATVRIGASAALGRTVKQSLDMYGGMAGG